MTDPIEVGISSNVEVQTKENLSISTHKHVEKKSFQGWERIIWLQGQLIDFKSKPLIL